MTQSPIRNLVPYARAAKAEGVHIHHLNIGQPDIPTPTQALAAIRDYDQSIVKYGASEGELYLRQTVRDYYREHVAHIDTEHIFATTGASEALLFTIMTCFDAGAEVIIPEPFYANYIGFAHIGDLKLTPITATIDSEFGVTDISKFKEKITADTKAILICNPSNPTGYLYSREQLQELADLAKEHDLFLIVDEVYREFCYENEFVTALSLDGVDDHVVVIDSISKVFSSCGSRIGFVVSKNEAVMRNILKYAELRLCPPMIGQHMAAACYIDREQYLADVRAEYDTRRQYLYERLSRIPGVKSYMPRAAFYIMTELPVADAGHFCKWLLTDYRRDGKTLMIAPGYGFYINQDAGKSQVRIAFILGKEALAESMDILEDALRVYQG